MGFMPEHYETQPPSGTPFHLQPLKSPVPNDEDIGGPREDPLAPISLSPRRRSRYIKFNNRSHFMQKPDVLKDQGRTG